MVEAKYRIAIRVLAAEFPMDLDLDFLWILDHERRIEDLRGKLDRVRLEHDLADWDLRKVKELADESLELKLRLGLLVRLLISKGVFTMGKDGKAHWVKVTTGIADDTYMEIKSGIQPGDEVISGSYSAISRKLKDGAKVAIDKETTTPK